MSRDSPLTQQYYSRAVINFCDSEGHLKPRDMKMPIAVNSSAWDRTSTHRAVVRCTTRPRGGGSWSSADGGKTVGLIDNSHTVNPVRAVTVYNSKRIAGYIG